MPVGAIVAISVVAPTVVSRGVLAGMADVMGVGVTSCAVMMMRFC